MLELDLGGSEEDSNLLHSSTEELVSLEGTLRSIFRRGSFCPEHFVKLASR